MSLSLVTVFEWSGTLTGLAGAALLAANRHWSGWGFAAFLVSNVFWMIFALMTHAYGLALMQVGFLLTSIVGLFRWLLLPPALKSRAK